MSHPTATRTLCHVEQAEQTAYWMYDNLLTILLRLERQERSDIPKLLEKVKTMHTDLGKMLFELQELGQDHH